jgi:hypothetical protein
MPEHEKFECPILRVLVIDGRNYYEVCRRDARWTDKMSSIVNLTISRFKPRPGESFSSYGFLLPLTAVKVQSLGVTDLAIHPLPEELDMHSLSASYFLAFEDVHDLRIMSQIIDLLGDPPQIWFTRCTFGVIADIFRDFGDDGGELVLAEIDQDMGPLLRLWHGHQFDVRRCPSFDDVILDMMGSEVNGTFACTTHLRILNISDCPNFSITALRRFVESRLHLADLSDNEHWWNPIRTRVRSLHLVGNVPSISEADRAWFEGNVRTFRCY